MKLLLLSILLTTSVLGQAAWLVHQTVENGVATIEKVTATHKKLDSGFKVLRSIPKDLFEDRAPTTQLHQEVLYADSALPHSFIPHMNIKATPTWPDSEVKTLIKQGPLSNRINLTIVGDGYTLEEKSKFFEDAQRITQDLFEEVTFKSYLPLFNVFAVFVPSKESGLSDRKKVDTALGLYRTPVGSKRGILYRNERTIDRAVALAPATDYPILMANDDFYGGLGGKYAITTRSIQSGALVLRHELGHNFGEVGEEYDEGHVYTGANFSASSDVTWAHWPKEDLEVYHSDYLFGDYLWKNLKNRPYSKQFTFKSESGRFAQIDLSSVGWSTSEDVKATINAKPLELEGLYTVDRSFFHSRPLFLEAGTHELKIWENIADGDNVLAAVRLYSYSEDYDFTPDKVAAFNVFDVSGRRVGYRPTHKSCLMRDMKLKHFCPVDQENIWVQFFKRIDLIDSLEVDGTITLKTPPLEGIKISWWKKRGNQWAELSDLSQSYHWKGTQHGAGDYQVRVSWRSSEIRKKIRKLDATQNFTL